MPQWRVRGEIIDYCSKYSQELRDHTSQGKTVTATKLSYDLPNAEEMTDKFDLRTDPMHIKVIKEE